MNKNEVCKECQYNTFKTRGGKGKLCNGDLMARRLRCPEWAINDYVDNNVEAAFSMKNCIEYHKVRR